MSSMLLLALGSLLVFFLPKRAKGGYALAVILAGAGVALTTAVKCLLGATFRTGEPLRWQYRTLFGLEYAVMDPLSALFVVIIALGAIAAAVYSLGYLRRYLDDRPGAHFSLHYLALMLLFFSMLGGGVVRGGYGFLICWELMTLSSFILILFEGAKAQVRKAALSYLVMMHVGFVFLLAGFITLQAKGLAVSFDSLGAYFGIYEPVPLFLLFLVGFGMKAGLFPLHTWLPEAHPAAPAHVSALMSGVMIKMGIYGVLRVMTYMQNGVLAAGIILLVAGIVTGIWGVLLAAVQNDVKRMLAYSSIENVGIIFLAMGASFIGLHLHSALLTLCAMGGALLHTLNHSLFKTLLFFGAGNIHTQAHTTSLERLGGLGKRMPFTAVVFLAGIVAICALPPLNGFASEFLIYFGFLGTMATGGAGALTAVGGVVALAFIGGVAMLALAKLYGVAFSGEPRSQAPLRATEVDGWRKLACLIPLAGMVAIGLAPMLVMGKVFETAGSVVGIGNASRIYEVIEGDVYLLCTLLCVMVLIVLGLYLLRVALLRGRKVTRKPTWGCGYGTPGTAMQYTGESLSEGLQSVAPYLAGKLRQGSEVGRGEIFPDEHTFSVERRDGIAAMLAAAWMAMWQRVNARVMAMRTGKVNYYLLHALLFLLVILLLSIFGWL